jgi:hypothetical protein
MEDAVNLLLQLYDFVHIAHSIEEVRPFVARPRP